MLMAAELEPPRQVFGHGWLLVGGEKMSKSKLTGISPNQITDIFGSDAFRYYFMKAIGFGSDGSFSWEDLSARYHSELANGFGNLASRTVAMVNRYFDGVIQAPGEFTDADKRVSNIAATATREADLAIAQIAPHEAIAKIWTLVDELNSHTTKPALRLLATHPPKNQQLQTQ